MKLIFTLIFCMLLFAANSQIKWNFTVDGNPSSGLPSNMTISQMSRIHNNGSSNFIESVSVSPGSPAGYSNSSGSGNAAAWIIPGGLDPTLNTNTYYEIIFTPQSGFSISISSIDFACRSTSTGAKTISIFSSINNYASAIWTTTVTNNGTWGLKQTGNISLTGTLNQAVTVRFVMYDGSGTTTTNNFRMDDLAINATANAVTPLTLLDFYSTFNHFPTLHWITAHETNLKEFVVERSANGSMFLPVSIIQAKNELNNRYSFQDGSASAKQFYRLKMIDLDGSFTYSKIISTEMPASNVMFKPSGLAVLRSDSRKKSIVIYNAEGKKILQTTTSEYDLDISALPKHQFYFAEIISTGNKQRLKFFND